MLYLVRQTEETRMTKVVLESGTLSKLAGIRETAILCDESGRAIGFFAPRPPRWISGRALDRAGAAHYISRKRTVNTLS